MYTFFKNYAGNEAGRIVPGFSLFFKKALYKVKASGQRLSFSISWYSTIWTYNDNKLYKCSDCLSRKILNFVFFEKGLELVSPPHFVYEFSRKIFLIFHLIN